jgi:hypothetical protein
MADIFVAYASQDVDRVRALVQLMSAQGWSVWWDNKIPIGKTFDVVIEGELARAACVVVLWSKASVVSEWVKNEASEGKRRNILVPAIIDDVVIPFEFRRVETAKLHDWNYQSTSHPELHEFFSAIGGIIQRPWTLDEGRAALARRDEPKEPHAPAPPDDAPAARPVPSEQQQRAKKLLAHWFAWSRIPDAVVREARQLVDRAPTTVEDRRRMGLLALCTTEDGVLFTRAWQALDGSPQAQRTPVERFEAFLTVHAADGELDGQTYREAMSTLGHEPRDQREARRHAVLTRFAENDDWDISIFTYLWKEMEEDAALGTPSAQVPGGHVPMSPGPSLETLPAHAAEGTSGESAAPPAPDGSLARDLDADAGTSGGIADGQSDGTTTESDAGDGTSDGVDTGERPPSDPPITGSTVRGRRQTVSAVRIAAAALAMIVGFNRPWERAEGGDESAVVTADTAPPAVTPPIVDSVATTPAVFLDSIRAQLALGRSRHDSARYAAAAEVVDGALRRLGIHAAALPLQERQALEDSLKGVRNAARTACAAEEASGTRIDEAGAPCPQ